MRPSAPEGESTVPSERRATRLLLGTRATAVAREAPEIWKPARTAFAPLKGRRRTWAPVYVRRSADPFRRSMPPSPAGGRTAVPPATFASEARRPNPVRRRSSDFWAPCAIAMKRHWLRPPPPDSQRKRGKVSAARLHAPVPESFLPKQLRFPNLSRYLPDNRAAAPFAPAVSR